MFVLLWLRMLLSEGTLKYIKHLESRINQLELEKKQRSQVVLNINRIHCYLYVMFYSGLHAFLICLYLLFVYV